MPKFLVNATQIINYQLEVEADNSEAAMGEAERVSDYHFDELCEVGREFTVDDAELIDWEE